MDYHGLIDTSLLHFLVVRYLNVHLYFTSKPPNAFNERQNNVTTLEHYVRMQCTFTVN